MRLTLTKVTSALSLVLWLAASATAQDQASMSMPAESNGWHFMQDGVLFGLFNHQGGPRGGDEFKVPNWWMGMTSRKIGASQFTFNTMLSLDPATVGKEGYRELFQVGEAIDGRPLIDRQHPHDFFMQLAGIWRMPLTARTGLTLAGGPAGEPALGPVAFMHRASAAENPLAPLSHHTFDSTHVAFGVITAAVDRGRWVVEGSVFNGREPDDNRWDFDFGRLDSYSGRVWFRPGAQWEFQASSGRLREPEELEPGDVTRTTVSGSWLKSRERNLSAVTFGYGRNQKSEGAHNSVFAEATRRSGANSIYGRLEIHQPEIGALTGTDTHATETLTAFTIGGVRDVLDLHGFEGGIGAGLTFYGVPETLRATHGNHPVSFQVFFRLRPPAPMGRMWNMRMSQPMAHQAPAAADPHAGHHMN
ncbi:MAG: hypothetical protein ND807_07775 [Vicinamibacterales bacterium]|nr:hypothetical protein [Vicinamibacterales bacterium]